MLLVPTDPYSSERYQHQALVLNPTRSSNLMTISLLPLPQSYKALIFDCNGTLANTLPVHFQTWIASLQAVGADISRDWYYQRCGISAREMLQMLKDELGYQFDSEVVLTTKQQHYRSLIHTIEEIQVVADVARSQYGKVPMAVASGGKSVVLKATLDSIGLRELFDVVISVDGVQSGKPEPDIFLLAARQLGVPPVDCVVYEDSDEGLEAAHRAKMRSIDVRQRVSA